MQDVCVSFWTGNGEDMIAKVTDICSTDPSDPSHCASPEDIKLPRTKVQVLRHKQFGKWSDSPQFSGNEDTEKVYWYFSKCLGEVSLPFSILTSPVFRNLENSSLTPLLTSGNRPRRLQRPRHQQLVLHPFIPREQRRSRTSYHRAIQA